MGIFTRNSNSDDKREQKDSAAGASGKPNDKPNDKASGKVNKDYSYKVNYPSQTEVVVEVEVTPEAFSAARDMAYAKLAPETNIAGFRAGKAPKDMIVAKLGARLFEEAINQLLPVLTANIISESKIEPLDYADYEVKKISATEGLAYEARFVILPDLKLPDFKKIKLTTTEEKVSEKDVNDLFTKLEQEIIAGRKKKFEENGEADKKEEAKEVIEESIDWEKELQLPDVKTESDVKERLRANIAQRKHQEFDEKQTEELIRQALLLFKIEPPKKLVAAEQQRLERQYTERIEKLGLKVPDFLKMQNTSLETLRTTWEKEAQFAIASDMMFILINKQEGIQVNAEELKAEIAKISDKQLQDYYSGPDGQRVMASIMARQKALARLREVAGVVHEHHENHDHDHDHKHAHDHEHHDHNHDHEHDHNHEGHDHDHKHDHAPKK